MRTVDPGGAWTRLQDALLTVKVGEEVSVDALMHGTGLARTTVERVLEGLTRIELFERKREGVFERISPASEAWSGGHEHSRSAALGDQRIDQFLHGVTAAKHSLNLID
jgi:DNA-binding IclR family transcriptional regulator